MISDEDLITVIRTAATEQLPIAVMTLKEMRQFAAAIAYDCIWHFTHDSDPVTAIKDLYGLPYQQTVKSPTESC